MTKRLVVLVSVFFSMMAAGLAQQPGLLHTGVEEPVVPAEACPDHSVIFRIPAPKASDVELFFGEHTTVAHPMTKSADGIWTISIGPVAPDEYQYWFTVGGAVVNPGIVTVPDSQARPYEVQDVPHGFVLSHRYFSKVQNRGREMQVYLPPEYFADPFRRFPVLYLIAGMDETDWTLHGRANVILDNFIAQKHAVPMILVMPNNTTGPHPVPALENAAVMEKEFTGEIIPYIDKTFRTIADRPHRGIAGVSFGGGTAFTVGMRHLETFAYVAEFGTGAFGGGDSTPYAPGYPAYDPDKITPGMYRKLLDPATRPKLFFMSVGTEDPRNASQKRAFADFEKNGIEPVFRTYPGGHEWKVFRGSLIDFLPMLFQ